MAKKRTVRQPKRKIKSSQKEQKPLNKRLGKIKSIPVLVKVISVLIFITAVATILAGFFILAASILGKAAISELGIEEMLREIIGTSTSNLDTLIPVLMTFLALLALFLIVFGLLQILIGHGLWKGKQWARIVTIIIMAFIFIQAVFFLDILSIIITGIIGGYLWFAPSVKKAFS